MDGNPRLRAKNVNVDVIAAVFGYHGLRGTHTNGCWRLLWGGKVSARLNQTEEAFMFRACTAEEWKPPGKGD